MQGAGQAIYLVAWRGDGLAGGCTVLTASKYDEIRQLLGAFPEMNALEARPPGQGTGTKIIACAERTAREHGAATMGLAVAVSNDGAIASTSALDTTTGATAWSSTIGTKPIPKPEIPVLGAYGIPLRDELELEKHP